MDDNTTTPHLTLDVDRDGLTGRLQLSINQWDADGGGHGYRIAGPKYNGTGRSLVRHRLDARDATEIRAYLDKMFPIEGNPAGNRSASEFTTPEDAAEQARGARRIMDQFRDLTGGESSA